MTSQPIRFFHRGRVVEVSGVRPTRSVLDWLREDARCIGTKEGCNEGDCGACTVVVGRAVGDQLVLETVNACIQFVPALDGRALFTVEDVPRSGGRALHPVQQALVEAHGSQCGFCTPGFVMSLWACYERHRSSGTRPARQQLADELAGNLCRCTGYRPILDAAERMWELAPVLLDREPVLRALRGMTRGPEGLSYAAPNPQAAGRLDRFDAPETLTALARLLLASPQARVLAGNTDIGLWVNKQFRDVGHLVSVGRVAELQRLEETADGLYIGAAVSLERAWQALVARHPALLEVWLRFASPPIRHAGTLGGNVANASPIGDAPPVLMALDAVLELRHGDVVRRVALAGFYRGYGIHPLEHGEFIQGIVVPRTSAAVRAYKISKRFDSDISAVCAGLAIDLDGDTVARVRLAFGGMAGTVKRATAAEAVMAGQPWTEATLRAAQQALATDFSPLSDLRGSHGYRLQVAQNLLRRFWLETRPVDPLPPSATRVFNAVAPATEGTP